MALVPYGFLAALVLAGLFRVRASETRLNGTLRLLRFCFFRGGRIDIGSTKRSEE
jgi:hypothetical protein